MNTVLLSIQLLPTYTTIAGVVILLHWVWLFGLKKKDALVAIPSKQAQTEVFAESATIEASVDLQESVDHQFEKESAVFSDQSDEKEFISSALHNEDEDSLGVTDNVSASADAATTAQVKEQYLVAKYAGKDVIPILEALQDGQLPLPMIQELAELSTLTLSTEQQYPYAIDLV